MQNDFKPIRRFDEIIKRIEQVRGYLGLNRSKFCRAIGMSPQTYNNFIGPQGTKPNIQLLHGVVTRFRANPMWIFTGRGNMFLTGSDVASTSHALVAAGVAEGTDDEFADAVEPNSEELATLVPTLRRIEGILERLDADKAPLITRFANVFRRYLELDPETGSAEIIGFLETVERKLATIADTNASHSDVTAR